MVLQIFNLPSLAEALACLDRESAASSDGGDVDITVPEKIGLRVNISQTANFKTYIFVLWCHCIVS